MRNPFASIVVLILFLPPTHAHALQATHAGHSETPETIATVRLLTDLDNHEFTIVVGPVDLPAGGQHEDGAHGGVYPPIGTIDIPFDAYITAFSYEVVDGTGRVLSSEFLHHLNINDPHHRELFLPISRRVLGASKETGAQSAPGWLLGLPLTGTDQLVVSAMFHNPTDTDMRDVSVRFRMRFKRGGFGPLFKAYPFHIDVAFPAGHKAFNVPPGRNTWHWEGSPAIAGRILGVGSHMHELIENITLTDITEDEQIWEGCPIYDDSDEVVGMTVGRLYRHLGTKVYPDRLYRVAVTYNNPTADTLIDGGMGVIAGLFSPARNAEWPVVDKSNPLYEIDRQHYMREVEGKWQNLLSQVPQGDQLQQIVSQPTGPQVTNGCNNRR